jgi:hypothetical protein
MRSGGRGAEAEGEAAGRAEDRGTEAEGEAAGRAEDRGTEAEGEAAGRAEDRGADTFDNREDAEAEDRGTEAEDRGTEAEDRGTDIVDWFDNREDAEADVEDRGIEAEAEAVDRGTEGRSTDGAPRIRGIDEPMRRIEFTGFAGFFFASSYAFRRRTKASVDPPGLFGWSFRASRLYSRASMDTCRGQNNLRKLYFMERILYILLALILLAFATLVVVETRRESFEEKKKKKPKKASTKKKTKNASDGEGVLAWMFKKPGE